VSSTMTNIRMKTDKSSQLSELFPFVMSKIWVPEKKRHQPNVFSFYPGVSHHADTAIGSVPSLLRLSVICRYGVFQKFSVEQV
jgi:hypothetical protein